MKLFHCFIPTATLSLRVRVRVPVATLAVGVHLGITTGSVRCFFLIGFLQTRGDSLKIAVCLGND